MVAIDLEMLKSDRVVYMERILQYEEMLQEHQAKVQELQVAIVHNKGALAHVNTNIEAIAGQMRVEEQERLKAEEEGETNA